MTVETHEHPHSQFLQDDDLPQSLYERARKASLDQRVQIGKPLLVSLLAHGVAGLFIDPERTTASSSSRPSRRGTALHHAHLSDEAFETIATSLAEGVGVTATARIQGVNKKGSPKSVSRNAV